MADNQNNRGGNKPKRLVVRFNLSWLYILLILGIGYLLMTNGSANPQKVEWADVEAMIMAGDVKEIHFVRNDYKGSVTIRQDRLAKYTDRFGGNIPRQSPHFIFLTSTKFFPEETFGQLNGELPADQRFKVVMENNSRTWTQVLEWLIFPILLILMWVWMFRGIGRNMGGGGGMPGFNPGKAPSKISEKPEHPVTFKDVAGLYGAKEEVKEIVDFLKSPAKYTALGAKIPKGALLVGPPGTGKTLLAKAVAGEAAVPFLSISGSDFVEMFVGVGASRVRDLFQQAKEKAPCIVFIDEIDAVGRARGKNVGFSSNDERENTLNQLLTEMDGFSTNSGVIVLAATNRADILDKALMRAGRFDRQIHVDLPELKEREEIFKVHMRSLKIAENFDLEFIAKHTPGFSGADIANVCNEAALTAARKGKNSVEMQDFLDAVDRIVGGIERKNATIMTPAEKRTTAYHEAGHAVVGWLLPNADPVFKVSLVPRGQALGITWSLSSERKIVSKSVMLDQMCMLYGGRVAEEIINGEPATGALNDLERLTKIAYSMVQYYGMSDKIGQISFYDSTGSRGYDLSKPYSEKTAEIIDQEVRSLVDGMHDRTMDLLRSNMDAFTKVAEILLEKEVIFADDLEAILGPKVKAETDAVKEDNRDGNEQCS
ncbi:MAG: ATP-dependent zinc metalloprotease FtsH [Candidatus Cryptobacteroides sp.]